MNRTDARPFFVRVVALFVLAAVFGAALTASASTNPGAYTTGSVPVVLLTAYILVSQTDDYDEFPKFLGVSTAIVAFLYVVGTVIAPPSIGLGPGWTSLAVAFVAAYAIIYGPKKATLSE
ncbi:hypothetical protein [Halovenus halobia]|uniref:hypothetical protein n=1 Tax=Halovenus halobia TaxID=3396622 RepID=UPI003F562CC1